MLYLIPFLHQTTTAVRRTHLTESCILFHFYIKPQPRQHNFHTGGGCILFHFYIKPQLAVFAVVSTLRCILFHFYIKPQLSHRLSVYLVSCILFHFYIKPQPMAHKTLFSSTLSPKSHSHFQRNAVV